MSGTISLDGLVSGYDTTSIIEAYVGVAASNLRNLQTSKALNEARLGKYEEFNSLVSSLQSSLQGIDELGELTSLAATSTDETVLTAEVTDESFPGSYVINVNNLAVAETSGSDQTFATASAAVAAGDVDITIDGTTYNITIDGSNDTLQGVADSINEEAEGVYAYVLNTGDGANPYRLMITSEETGDDGSFTINGGTTGLTFTEEVTAENAEIEVNGVTVFSDTNTLQDVVPGVTLTLNSESIGPVTVAVNRDFEGIEANLQGFVDSYNAVMDFISDEFAYNEDYGAGILSGDSTLRYVQRTLQNVVTSTFNSGSAVESLSQLGISTRADGGLSLDSDDLQDALLDNYTEVMDLFTGSGAMLETMDTRLDIFLDGSDGSLKIKTDGFESTIESLEDKILSEQTRLDRYEQSLVRRFAAMETTLSFFGNTKDYLTALFEVQNKK